MLSVLLSTAEQLRFWALHRVHRGQRLQQDPPRGQVERSQQGEGKGEGPPALGLGGSSGGWEVPPGLRTLSLLELRNVVTSVTEKPSESGVLPVVKAHPALGSRWMGGEWKLYFFGT